MKFKILLALIFIGQIFLFSQEEKEIKYIIKYSKLAIDEMDLFKIPASIKIAQGLIETGGGQSRLADKANNHFGIKCKAEWKGETIYHDDDAIGECFRKYAEVKESYRDHSKFLSERPYYKSLFNLPILDYKAWSYGLKKSGYATNPNYPEMLISKIEKYKLYEFDLPLKSTLEEKLLELFPNYTNEVFTTPLKERLSISFDKNQSNKSLETEPKRILEQEKLDPKSRIQTHPNGIKYIILQKGESISKIGAIYLIPEKDLLYYNDLLFPSLAKENQIIFLEKKKNAGSESTYIVQKGETMYEISQKLGIDLYYLHYFNDMKHTQAPIEGQKLFLKYIKK